MVELKKSLFQVNNGSEQAYGGAQRWFKKKTAQEVGCGIIACANILAQIGEIGEGNLEKDVYMNFTEHLRKFYLPVFPIVGMNGIFMMIGMNLFFLRHKLPYTCYWGAGRKNFDGHIERMLEENIPPVLSVGPNFPNLFGKHRVTFYTKAGERYVPGTSTQAHYVSVTGMDEFWYRISSWGKQYYVSKKEYEEYRKKHSGHIVSNILVVKRKK